MTFTKKNLRKLAALIGAASLFPTATIQRAEAADLSIDRQVDLTRLVRNDCGSCHGLTLKGGLGPALTPEALKTMPVELLMHWIKNGRPENGMPAWRVLLTEDDMRFIAEGLKRGSFVNIESTQR